jgi:hypothetical protein
MHQQFILHIAFPEFDYISTNKPQNVDLLHHLQLFFDISEQKQDAEPTAVHQLVHQS